MEKCTCIGNNRFQVPLCCGMMFLRAFTALKQIHVCNMPHDLVLVGHFCETSPDEEEKSMVRSMVVVGAYRPFQAVS